MYPGINLSPNFRIDHVNRNRNVIDIEFFDAIDMIGQHQAIRREAKFNIGRFVRNQFKSTKSLFGVWPRNRPGLQYLRLSFGESYRQ